MRCHTARRAIFELGLGLRTDDGDSALARHLLDCAACAAAARDERRFVAELALLGGEYPDNVEIAPQVMQRIAKLDDVVRHEVSRRQLAWAAAAAIVIGLVATVAFIDSLPATAHWVAGLRGIASATGSLLQGFGAALMTLAAAAGKLIGLAMESFSAIGSALRVAQPVVSGLFGLAYLMMAMAIALVVYRDWTGQSVLGARKEF